MQTSNYKTAGTHPDAVGISIGAPRGWKGRRYLALAPTWAMLKMSQADYITHFREILAKLDPEKVANDLGDNAILLCWESFNVWCHRRWVAEWLEQSLGIEVPELGHARSESLELSDMPEKAEKKKSSPGQIPLI